MKFIKLNSGLTVIELMVVMVIIGLLGRMGIKSFGEMKRKEEYEKFVYTLHHYTQEARNMAKVNKSSYSNVSGIDTFKANTNYGVYFNKISYEEAEMVLFQDLNNDNIYGAGDNVIKSEKIYKVVNIDEISLVKSTSQTTTSSNSNINITIIFQPDPNPEALIRSSTDPTDPAYPADPSKNFRFVEIKFHHEYVKDVVQKSLRKKFTFDTLSNFSQVNDYPIITGAIKSKKDEISLEVNEPLETSCVSADVIADIDIPGITPPTGVKLPSNATCNNKGIVLTFNGGDLPTSGIIKITYKNNKQAVKTDGENLVLPYREVEINLD